MGDKWDTVKRGDFGWLKDDDGTLMGFWAKTAPRETEPMSFAPLLDFLDERQAAGEIVVYDAAKARMRTGAVSVHAIADHIGGGNFVVTADGLSFAPVGRVLRTGERKSHLPTGLRSSVKLPDLLAGADDLNIQDVVRRASGEELRQLLFAIPVESITLDQHIAGATQQHDRLFEVTLAFCAVLSNYKSLRKKNGLPDIPAAELLDLILPRFLARLRAHSARDILPAAAPRLVAFARDLVMGGRNREALDCLAVCREVPTSNRDEIALWTCTATLNVAFAAKDRGLLQEAVDLGDNLPEPHRASMSAVVASMRRTLARGWPDETADVPRRWWQFWK